MLNLVSEQLLELASTQNTHEIESLRSFIGQVMLFLNPSKNQRPSKLSTVKKDALGIDRNTTAGNVRSKVDFDAFSELMFDHCA